MCIFFPMDSSNVPTVGTVWLNCYCCCGITVCGNPRTTLNIAVTGCRVTERCPVWLKNWRGCCICLAAQLLEILVCKYHCRTGLAQGIGLSSCSWCCCEKEQFRLLNWILNPHFSKSCFHYLLQSLVLLQCLNSLSVQILPCDFQPVGENEYTATIFLFISAPDTQDWLGKTLQHWIRCSW